MLGKKCNVMTGSKDCVKSHISVNKKNYEENYVLFLNESQELRTVMMEMK